MRISVLAALLASAPLVQGIASAQASSPKQESQMAWLDQAKRDGVTVRLTGPGQVMAPIYPDAMDVVLKGPNPYPPMILSDVDDDRMFFDLSKKAEQLLYDGDFAELEIESAKFRTTDKLAPSGGYRSAGFFSFIKGCGCTIAPDRLERLRTMARQYLKAYPDSSTAVVFEAMFRESLAWSGHGGNQSQDEWAREAAGGLLDTGDFLSRNWQLARKEPYAYVLLTRLAAETGHEPETIDKIMATIAAEQPDFLPAWFAAADYATLLKTSKYAEHVALEAAKAASPNLADATYARIVYHSWTHGLDLIFDDAPVDRARFWKGVEDILRVSPTRHNFIAFGSLACDQQEWDRAEPLIARLQVLDAASLADFEDYVPCRVKLYYRHH